jgi:hypothetical protein
MEWCSVIIWYQPRYLIHLRPHVVTLWATIGTHLWAKMAENGWIQFFDKDSYHNLLFYTQICSMGRWAVFNYPMIIPKVPTILVTPYSYPMGHHSHLFVSKNGQKRLKTGFWGYLPPYPLIIHTNMFYGQQVGFKYPMVAPKVPATLKTPHSYPMGKYSHSFVSKNGRKWLKTVFWRKFLP